VSDWLKILKAGDLVVRVHGYGRMSERLVAVASVTATLVRVAITDRCTEEYNRTTGRLRGNTGMMTVRLEEATPEARARIRASLLADRLSMVKWDAVPPDVLEQVSALVNKAT
jgi:hypothetical protein